MKIISVFLLTIISIAATAQSSGIIKYTRTIQLDLKSPDGMDLGDMLPKELTSQKELLFDKKLSVYLDAKENEDEEREISSDDGGFKMVFKSSSGEEIYHTDLKEKITTHSTSFMSKEFLVVETLERLKWKITDEKIKYLGFVCQKATCIEPASEEDQEDKEIVAWFTSEIPTSIGPAHYNSLPGAILMISVDEGKTEIKATEVIPGEIKAEQLDRPTKGQEVSGEEYDKIMEEKLQEMGQMNGSRSLQITRR